MNLEDAVRDFVERAMEAGFTADEIEMALRCELAALAYLEKLEEMARA